MRLQPDNDELAPACADCRRIMRFHSLQTVQCCAPELPQIMQVFTCDRCSKWEALPDAKPTSPSYRIHKLLLLVKRSASA
jgi:hypothetical protein